MFSETVCCVWDIHGNDIVAAISVYITSYNQKGFLSQAIDSVLNQTLHPMEIIVVDDCSTDGSQELISGYCSRYPHLFRTMFHDTNLGISRCRQEALSTVRGEYVTWVDGDDRFLPEKLASEYRLLQNSPHARIAFSNICYMDADGMELMIWAEEESPPQGDVFVKVFARDFPRRNLFRSELVHYPSWKSIGFHDPQLKLYEDFEMRIRLSSHYQGVYCPKILSEYRFHEGGLSRSDPKMHIEALTHIWHKNKLLLNTLSEDRQEYVRTRFNSWMAPIYQRAGLESFEALVF